MTIIEAKIANKTQAVISPLGNLYPIGMLYDANIRFIPTVVFGTWALKEQKPIEFYVNELKTSNEGPSIYVTYQTKDEADRAVAHYQNHFSKTFKAVEVKED